MEIKKKVIAVLLVLCMLIGVMPATALTAFANTAAEKVDAMTAIEELSQYKCGETQTVSDDGYIGIPVEMSVYFKGESTVKNDVAHDATPVVIYVVNTMVERIGILSDVEIMTSMLNRGYIVVVFDYLNNEKAVSPALDWSVQTVRTKVTKGTVFSDLDGFPSGSYYNNLVAPAGYNVEFNHIFWEIDKYCSDGTFEKIVEVWNNDFRSWKGEKLVKWVDADGNRKSTQNGHDGTAPVWLDANGAEDENGEYINVKHTLATSIEDCVQADGTPIDLNLYMHIVYPTAPESDVPVMTLSCSSGHLAKGTQTADRPQLNGFLFNGYAAVTFDYGYTPMARDDHYGYFDGSTPQNGSVTGDNVTYSIHWYNETKIDTAAMRYLRYLSASDHSTYTFKDTAIGVYGNSKGGWATLLGEEHPELFPERRIAPGYTGASRYETGKTEDSMIGNYCIDGGEEQPWLTYNGNALDSGADFIYSSCGGGDEQITSAHAPTFISCNTGDGSYYGTSNRFVNICRNLDVPALWFEVNQGHTFASEKDLNYGVSTYEALFTFANYYLREDAVSVIYAARDAAYSGMPSNAPIVVKFSGAVSAEEIAKVVLKDAGGNIVSGTWSAQFGNTEWTLTTPTLSCDTEYTLTVPAGIKGDNGKEMESEYVRSFRTGYEKATAVSTLAGANGTYFYFTMPDITAVTEFNTDLYALRLNVTNDAVNRLEIYPVTGFDAASPDSGTVGSAIDNIPVSGAGQYDFDLTEHLTGVTAGSTVAFLVKQVKEASETVNNSAPLTDSVGDFTVSGTVSYTFAETPDGVTAMRIDSVSTAVNSYINDAFYYNPSSVMSNNKIIKSGNLSASDVGRRFVISFKVYDTTSRIMTVKMNSLTSSAKQFADYDAYSFNFYTKANEWVEFEFEYTVYEPLYEAERGAVTQSLNITTVNWGVDSPAYYLSDVKCTEIVTDVTLGGAELLLSTTEQRVDPLITEYGTIPAVYEDTSEYPYVLFDADGNCLAAGSTLVTDSGDGVLGTLQDSTTVKDFVYGEKHILLVRDDVVFDTVYNNLSLIYGDVVIDLMGNTFTCTGMLFNASAKRCSTTNITVKNGTILQKDRSLITYRSATSDKYDYETNGIKKFNFVFENVTFGYAEGATAKPFVTANVSSAPTPANMTVSLVDCTVDLTSNAPSGTYTLFDATADTEGNLASSITVKGGVIKANTMEGVTVGTASGDNSFEFIKDGSGNYTTVLLPESASAPSGSYTAGGNSVVFTASSTADGYTTYELDIDPLWTPYGVISEAYASAEDYPFVGFKVNDDGSYTFSKAESNIFTDSSSLMIAARTAKMVIYMRRDFAYSGSTHNNFANIDSSLIIDFGGNTLALNNMSSALYVANCKAKLVGNTDVTFKNGTIALGAYPFINFKSLSAQDSSVTGSHSFEVTFDSVTFQSAQNVVTAVAYADGKRNYTADVTYNNCIFDYSQATGSGTLFVSGDAAGTCVGTVKVNGGKLITSSTDGITLSSVGNTDSTVLFGMYDGSYTVLETADSSASASFKVNTAEGEMVYGISGADTVVTYSLFPITDILTEYGEIVYSYASKELYPFVQFKDNGDGTYTFLGAESDIFADSSQLMINARSKTTVILMRRDYEKSTSGAHSNLVHVNGTATIDYGGNTLTLLQGSAYSANAKKNEYASNIIFKNGNIVLSSGPFMVFNSTFEDEATGQAFHITFDRIAFKLASGATTKYIAVRYDDGLRTYDANVTYNGCVFDMTNAVSGIKLFDAGSVDGKATASVTVNGGQILNATTLDNLVSENNDASTVRFGKYGDSYLTASVASTPTGVYETTEEGSALFTATETSGVYMLTPCSGNLPKIASTNVRFGNALSLLVAYHTEDLGNPVEQNLVAVINGTSIDTVWTKDSEMGYYIIELTGINAKEIADIFTIVIKDAEGNAVTETEQVSIRDYAISILQNPEKTDAYKQVVMDLLNYGAAAQEQYSYNTGNLANAGCDDYQQYASNSMKTVTNDRTMEIGGDFGGSSLRFNDKINIMFRFKTSLDTYAVFTWTDYKGVAHSVTVTSDKYTSSDGYYVVELENELVVADARQAVTCTIYNGTNTEDRTSVVISVTDSVQANVARVSAAYKDLYESFMMYADATNTYLTTK